MYVRRGVAARDDAGCTEDADDDDVAVQAEGQAVLIEVLQRGTPSSSPCSPSWSSGWRARRSVAQLGNSSMPPSAHAPAGKTASEPSRGRGAGSSCRGSEPGAAGALLAWSESSEKSAQLFLAGALRVVPDLADRSVLAVAASHQVIGAPVVRLR